MGNFTLPASKVVIWIWFRRVNVVAESYQLIVVVVRNDSQFMKLETDWFSFLSG
jgi:hypothetical protein